MALKNGKRKKKEDEEIVQFEYRSPDLREKRARDWDKKQKNEIHSVDYLFFWQYFHIFHSNFKIYNTFIH